MEHRILGATLNTNDAPTADITSTGRPDIALQLAAELVRSTKLDVLIAALDMVSVEHLNMPEQSVQQFETALATLSYQEFVQLPTKKSIGTSTVLGIDNTPSTLQFTYTEKKAICATTMDVAARRILQPVLDFMRERKRREQASACNVFQLEDNQLELRNTERRRQQLQADVLDAELRRMELLQRAVNLRCCDQLTVEMDVLHRRLKLNCEKVGLLKAMVEREFVNRSDHAGKALKQIENYMDVVLDVQRSRRFY